LFVCVSVVCSSIAQVIISLIGIQTHAECVVVLHPSYEDTVPDKATPQVVSVYSVVPAR